MATKDATKGKKSENGELGSRTHSLPDEATCRLVLAKMMLIRRFEERAGEMYAKAKIGGFLHLCIGEEATVVGGTQALRDRDYLMSTYREHGQALARGTDPKAVMAELFGRQTAPPADAAARCTSSTPTSASSAGTASWAAAFRSPPAWPSPRTTRAPRT